MIKICLLSFVVFCLSACAPTERKDEPKLGNAPVVDAAKPQSTPDGSHSQSETDLQRLDERFPKQMREVLEMAKSVQVYETEVCSPGKGFTLSPIKKGLFQGCKVLRQADITDPESKRRFLDGVYSAIGSSDSGAACFDPRHGVRAEYEGNRVELLICFECENFRGSSGAGSFAGGFSRRPKELFERILTAGKSSGK